MEDTRAHQFRGWAGCWAGRASIPTANWWRRSGAGQVCGQGGGHPLVTALMFHPRGLPQLSQVQQTVDYMTTWHDVEHVHEHDHAQHHEAS